MKKLAVLALLLASAGIVFKINDNNIETEPSYPSNEFSNATISTTPTSDKIYTQEDIAKHNSKTDCWTIVEEKVYDITPFIALGKHKPIIEKGCGIDATEMFMPKHKDEAKEMLKNYLIGTFVKEQ